MDILDIIKPVIVNRQSHGERFKPGAIEKVREAFYRKFKTFYPFHSNLTKEAVIDFIGSEIRKHQIGLEA